LDTLYHKLPLIFVRRRMAETWIHESQVTAWIDESNKLRVYQRRADSSYYSGGHMGATRLKTGSMTERVTRGQRDVQLVGDLPKGHTSQGPMVRVGWNHPKPLMARVVYCDKLYVCPVCGDVTTGLEWVKGSTGLYGWEYADYASCNKTAEWWFANIVWATPSKLWEECINGLLDTCGDWGPHYMRLCGDCRKTWRAPWAHGGMYTTILERASRSYPNNRELARWAETKRICHRAVIRQAKSDKDETTRRAVTRHVRRRRKRLTKREQGFFGMIIGANALSFALGTTEANRPGPAQTPTCRGPRP